MIKGTFMQLSYSAKIVDKQNFKYLDELAIMKYLKENGYDQFIKQSIL